MLPLPEPQSGGTIDELRSFLNLRNDNDWALVVSWLLAAMLPSGPYPILLIQGEQGSGKSTFTRTLVSLVDPKTAVLRGEPREVRDLIAAAKNARVIAFDNLSRLSPQLADAACRLATGGGFGGRQLYTDTEEAVFEAIRPQMYNGIPELGTSRADFLERSIMIRLPAIPGEARRSETEYSAKFEEVRPRALGVLLDAVSKWLELKAGGPQVISDLPRMADFAIMAVSVESALGLRPGSFRRAYDANRTELQSIGIGDSPLVEPILELCAQKMRTVKEEHHFPLQIWQGTPTQLLGELSALVGEDLRRSPSWPRTPGKVRADLDRAAAHLRELGVEIKSRRSNGKRLIEVVALRDKPGETPSLPSLERAKAVGYLTVDEGEEDIYDLERRVRRSKKTLHFYSFIGQQRERQVRPFPCRVNVSG
jgi:energy-coupling factor transporter ATP-binding protein EcfA2